MMQFIAKILIFGVIVFYLIYVFQNRFDFSQEMQIIVLNVWQKPSLLWSIPFFLIFVNWAFEALKWKHLIHKIEQISFWEAYQGILTGLSIGFVIPKTAGNYIGRVFQLKQKRRSEVMGALMISQMSQLTATLFFGGIGLVVYTFYLKTLELITNQTYWIVFIVTALCLCLLFAIKNFVLNYLKTIRFSVLRFILIIKTYELNDYLKVFTYSFLRYFTFAIQFLLVLHLYGVETSYFLLFCGISLVYLTKSLMISFNFLSDLGVREASALFFLGQLGISQSLILVSSLTLWALNILLPTIVGTLFVWRMKFFVKD